MNVWRPLYAISWRILSFKVRTWGLVRGIWLGMSRPEGPWHAQSKIKALAWSVSWLRITARPGNRELFASSCLISWLSLSSPLVGTELLFGPLLALPHTRRCPRRN